VATSYTTIIERFLPTVKEYLYADIDEDELYELVCPYIISAATQFNDACIVDLNDRDDEAREFVNDLSDEEIDILVDLMRVEWLKHKLYNSELLRNGMSTKDYTVFSPANLQNQIRITYQDAREEARMRLYQYSYTHPLSNKLGGVT